MVLLQLTPPLESRLRALATAVPVELAEQLLVHLNTFQPPAIDAKEDGKGSLQGRTISHELLVRASAWARKDGGDKWRSCTLASLLRLTDIHIASLAPRERSPELVRILSTIQLAQDKAAYARMISIEGPQFVSVLPMSDIHDPASTGRPPLTIAEEWTEVRRELGAIVNVGASMFAVGTAVWWVGGGRSYTARLCLALGGAAAIAIIEAFLYYRFFTRDSRTGPSGGKKSAVLQFDLDRKME